MKKGFPFLWIVFVMILLALACNLPLLPSAVQDTNLDKESEQTVEAGVEVFATKPQIQPPVQQATTPTPTSTITATPSITPSPTPTIPMARVSQNTNCRTGPGTEYDIVYIFMVGEEAEIIARSSVPNYVIIKVPDGSGRKCWLWMQYGEQTGDMSGLPQETPPPTPTPEATPTPELDFTLQYETIDNCFGSTAVFLRITNSGALKLESFNFTATDQDTSQTVSHAGEAFSPTATCMSISPKDSLTPGDYGFIAAGFVPPIGGHTVKFSVKLCGGAGLAEPCRSKSISVNVPSASDVNAKKDFQTVDPQEILNLISNLPIMSWSYIDPDRDGRHIGPMAQDFNELFGVGDSEEYINSVDSYGVALAAIQALAEMNEDQAQRITTMEDQNEALRTRLETLETQGRQQLILLWVILIGFMLVALSVVIVNRSRLIRKE